VANKYLVLGQMLSADRLKSIIYAELKKSGFGFERNALVPPDIQDKSALRRIHKPAREHLLLENRGWILKNEGRFLDFFADGSDIIPDKISPKLVLIEDADDKEKTGLFRYASYLWSIPLSGGFGRRLRYLIMDESNGKLIGIIGLTDPVIGLKVRDTWIGWTKEQKERALWHTMDAYAFGAVQPYNYLLGGKMVATLATSDTVREDFRKKYGHGRSVISHKNYKSRKPYLVLLTTTGAYGKSSILDRLNTSNRQLWQLVGYTEGWGFFHLNNGIATEIYEYLKQRNDPIVNRNRFGQGPNWKLRLIREGMQRLGLDYDKYGKHGVKRGFYAAPLAKNFREFLRGEEKEPVFYEQSAKALFDFFKTRYLIPRAQRNSEWRLFDHRSLRLSQAFRAFDERAGHNA
jgi:hypothetical protein